ncbi:carbon monoxide dehydrogenase maturation protein [Amycolatopsis sp. NPDC051373]|uniref:carbon monoxide dehydrogenase maturation protein n=1 Tax=Amycolatopsis sp. NPDC051373 TaxID=3155801 RepID=UPI00344F5D9C
MLVALCSVKGSPGVTTLAVALARHWPNAESTRRLVVEVDPSGGDLAARCGVPATPGLVSLAAVARRTADPAVVWEHTYPLPGGARMLVAPPGGVHARAAMHTLAMASGGAILRGVARDPWAVVLADCGRVDPGSPAEALARGADVLLLLTRVGAEDLAHAAARLGELARWTPRPGLVLVGEGYPTVDVERDLGVPAIGRIPHDPAAATILSGPSRLRRGAGALDRQAAVLARALATRATPSPAAPPTPAMPFPGGGLTSVPGVPDQQVRLAGGDVVRLPRPPHQQLRPAPTPPPHPAGPTGNGPQLRLVRRGPA